MVFKKAQCSQMGLLLETFLQKVEKRVSFLLKKSPFWEKGLLNFIFSKIFFNETYSQTQEKVTNSHEESHKMVMKNIFSGLTLVIENLENLEKY